MNTRYERVLSVVCVLLIVISMTTAGLGLVTAPAAAQSDTNSTATVSDDFEAYTVGATSPGPWTAPSGSSGNTIVSDSFLGDRSLETTDSDGSAIYEGATVDSSDFAIQAVARGTNSGGYVEFGDVTLEVNPGEFTDRLRLSDGTDETIVDEAGTPEGEWVNIEFVGDGGNLSATVWAVGTEKPTAPDIELAGVDKTGDLEFSTVNTDDVFTVDQVSVQPYSTLGSSTVAGTVTDQYGEPVPNATVQAVGVTTSALPGDDLDAEADDLLQELSNPLPSTFDPDADLADTYANAEGTYAAVHPASAWNLGGVSLGSGAVSTSITPSLDTPGVVLPADEQLIVSTWDAGDAAVSQDGVDSSLPGATTADPVVIEQLGPTGETTHTRTVDPQPLVEVTALANLGTKTHEGAAVDLPPGIYRVHPEDTPETAVVVAVDDPTALANTIEADLRDDADRLTARADRVRELTADGGVTELATETNATGAYTLSVPSNVEAVHLQAFGVGGDTQAVLDTDAENASLAAVRDAYADGYTGTLTLSTTPVRTTPPDEQADLTVQRLDAPPVASPDAFAQRLDAWANDTLDTRLSDLSPSAVDDLTGDELTHDLTAVHDDLDALRDQNKALDARVRDRLDDGTDDPANLDDDALAEQVAGLQTAVDDLQHTIDAEASETDLSDGLLSYETVFDATIPAEAVAITATYADGTTERIGDEYVTVESGGVGPLSSTTVAIDEYPVPAGTQVADVRVQVAGAERLGESRNRVASNALDDDLATLDAITVSTFDPGPDDRVTLGVDAGDTQTRVTDVAARNAAGESVTATVDAERDLATVHTDGQGLHTIALTYAQAGVEVTETLRVEAGSSSGSTPATIRMAEGASGAYAITSGLGGATTDTSGDELAVTARAAEDAPGTVHLHPQTTMNGDVDTLDVEVVQVDGETALDRHASVYVHTTGLGEDALVWRNGNPITREGDTQYGEVLDRGDGKAVVSTYTDADGAVILDVRHDPSALERAQHWTAARSPIDIPGLSG